jgi:hypothetical protein
MISDSLLAERRDTGLYSTTPLYQSLCIISKRAACDSDAAKKYGRHI